MVLGARAGDLLLDTSSGQLHLRPISLVALRLGRLEVDAVWLPRQPDWLANFTIVVSVRA